MINPEDEITDVLFYPAELEFDILRTLYLEGFFPIRIAFRSIVVNDHGKRVLWFGDVSSNDYNTLFIVKQLRFIIGCVGIGQRVGELFWSRLGPSWLSTFVPLQTELTDGFDTSDIIRMVLVLFCTFCGKLFVQRASPKDRWAGAVAPFRQVLALEVSLLVNRKTSVFSGW